jgi:3-oxoacyl-[acyl-carrier protein] reductase
MLLKDQVALVTGATRGIGLAVVRSFLKQGAHVFATGRQLDPLEDLQRVLQDEGHPGSLSILLLDVSDPNSVRDAFQQVFKQSRRLDVLVANAGVLDDALIAMVTPDQVQRTFEVNTFGVLYCAQYASRLMARHQHGSIVCITSIIGTNGNTGQAVYGGSKAAVIGITKSLAKELADKNIRVNAIAPGFIDTDMARSLTPEKFAERTASINMGRIGRAEEVADVALFLASNMSSYVTGQVIGVDGGMQI